MLVASNSVDDPLRTSGDALSCVTQSIQPCNQDGGVANTLEEVKSSILGCMGRMRNGITNPIARVTFLSQKAARSTCLRA
jgi:hypothetical protein